MTGGPESGRFAATVWHPTTTTGAAPVPAPAAGRPQVATIEAAPWGASNNLTAFLGPAPAGSAYMIRRITVSLPNDPGSLARAYVFVGIPSPEHLVMSTRSGALDYALEDPPLFVPESTQLAVLWDVGPSRALARFEYLEV